MTAAWVCTQHNMSFDPERGCSRCSTAQDMRKQVEDLRTLVIEILMALTGKGGIVPGGLESLFVRANNTVNDANDVINRADIQEADDVPD